MLIYSGQVATEIRTRLLNNMSNSVGEKSVSNTYTITRLIPEAVAYERYKDLGIVSFDTIKLKCRDLMESGISRKEALLMTIKPIAEACNDTEIEDVINKAFEDMENAKNNTQ